jgi:hypothetical protein
MRTAPLALALVLALGGAGCKKQNQSGPTRKGRVETPAAVRRPTRACPSPHRLSQEPPAGAHIADPDRRARRGRRVLLGGPRRSPSSPRTILSTQGPADFAKAMTPFVAADAAWTGAHVNGEDILQIPLSRATVAQADALLTQVPEERRVRRGQPPARRPRAAPEQPRSARRQPARPHRLGRHHERHPDDRRHPPSGIATGRLLAAAVRLAPAVAHPRQRPRRGPVYKFPYGRVTATGDGTSPTSTSSPPPARPAAVRPPRLRPRRAPWHARRPRHRRRRELALDRLQGGRPRGITHQLQVAVNRAGFAGKMMLDPIADQATRVLKAWNGRVFIGIGPARHVRVGFGADDPNAAGRCC